MNESEMIGVIVIALGTILGVGVVVVKPMLQVVRSITELNESIKSLARNFNVFETNNNNSHKRIWDHNEEQDKQLQDHETRIRLIEKNRNQ
jgi:cell division protein FtsL